MRIERASATALCLALLLMAGAALAAPLDGNVIDLRQPDGSTVQVKVYGDEFYARMETLDGYSAVRDTKTGWLCYALLTTTGDDLVSTGVRVGKTPPVGISRGLRPGADAVREQAESRRAAMLGGAKDLLDHTPVTLGNVRGITLLVEFADVPHTVESGVIDARLNELGHTEPGYYGSARDYFRAVSTKKLDYTNYVTPAYYAAPHNMDYYEGSYNAVSALVAAMLDNLDASGFDFSQYDVNADGTIDAINILYAGAAEPNNALWPHFTWDFNRTYDGVRARYYQISDISGAAFLGKFCHESGHQIGAWPDLYDIDYSSSGLGRYCLMAGGGTTNRPVAPNVWLRTEAGWVTPVVLNDVRSQVKLSTSYAVGARIPHPDPARAFEFYMIENRQATGWDSYLPDPGGLAIYHVDTSRNSQMNENHYMVHLVQADGLQELEHGGPYQIGGDGDLWHAPTATHFDFSTTPAAFWWDGAAVGLNVVNIGPMGTIMSFGFQSPRIAVAVAPAGLPAPWTLSGPGGFTATGVGDFQGTVPRLGAYTLTWGAVPGYGLPVPPTVTLTVGLGGGSGATFAGSYSAPFLPAGGFGDAMATCVNVVDVDDDGLSDIFIGNHDGANLLLRNEGGLAFDDIATTPLSDAPDVTAAVWADFDDDGDQDLFLASDYQGGTGNGNLLLEQVDGTFVDRTALTPQFATLGAVEAAAVTDYDRDGHLDLHLVRYDAPDLLFRGNGAFAFVPGTATFGLAGVQHTSAAWGDLNDDGWSDMFVCAAGSSETAFGTLAVNVNGVLSHPWGHAGWIQTAQDVDCEWADINGDQRLDLLVLSRYGNLQVFQNSADHTWTEYSLGGNGGDAADFTVADFNGDGRPDIFITYATVYEDGGDYLALNQGDLDGDLQTDFAAVPLRGAIFTQPHSCVAAGDLDNDGDLDLVLGSPGGSAVLLENRLAVPGGGLKGGLPGVNGTEGGEMPSAGPRTTFAAPYPNPFNPSTNIEFSLARAGRVRVVIFGLDGRRVAELQDGDMAAGPHRLVWQGRDSAGRGVASGAYLCRIEADGQVHDERLTLVK